MKTIFKIIRIPVHLVIFPFILLGALIFGDYEYLEEFGVKGFWKN